MASADIETVHEAFKQLALDILDVMAEVLESDVAINDKTNTNTLRRSQLKRNMTVNESFPRFIYFEYFDYLEYVERGRRPNTRKVPISALREWAMRKGIPSDNSTLYAIQQSIYKVGISPRPIMETFQRNLDKEMGEDLLDGIYDAIIQQLDKYLR